MPLFDIVSRSQDMPGDMPPGTHPDEESPSLQSGSSTPSLAESFLVISRPSAGPASHDIQFAGPFGNTGSPSNIISFDSSSSSVTTIDSSCVDTDTSMQVNVPTPEQDGSCSFHVASEACNCLTVGNINKQEVVLAWQRRRTSGAPRMPRQTVNNLRRKDLHDTINHLKKMCPEMLTSGVEDSSSIDPEGTE